MQRKKQTKGRCTYCGQEMAKAGMTRHLPVCPQRQAGIAVADDKRSAPETLYHLRVQDAYSGVFWLDLEMRGSAPLKELDAYLRAIWLECCGHMSQFSVGGWSGEEIPMSRKIAQVFPYAPELTHIYDFGTSSVTLVKAVGSRQGKPTTSHPIALMARNLMPETECMECDQPAAWLCMECMIEEDESGLLCDEHADEHPHEDYGAPLPLVNSPRCGMCGYDGSAEAPY